MDKQTYIDKKRAREKRELFRKVCMQCFRPLPQCLCPIIRPLQTRTRFIILMHPKEAKKTRNGTGRLAHLSLQNSELLFGVDFTENSRLNALISDPHYVPLVLFPGKDFDPNFSCIHRVVGSRESSTPSDRNRRFLERSQEDDEAEQQSAQFSSDNDPTHPAVTF